MPTFDILDKLGSIVGGVFAVAGFVVNLVALRRTPAPGSSPVEERRVRSRRHVLVKVGVALLVIGLALLAGAWWAGSRDTGHPTIPDPSVSAAQPSGPVSTGPTQSTPAQSTPPGPRPDRAGRRSITMRPYPIPQNNYDPRTDKLYPEDTAALTFECRRRRSNDDLQAGCKAGVTPVFTLTPNKNLGVQVAEVPPAAASRGFPMACDELNNDDDPDFIVIIEGGTYCAQTGDWVAVIRVEDLPEKITPASPVITVQVSYWRR